MGRQSFCRRTASAYTQKRTRIAPLASFVKPGAFFFVYKTVHSKPTVPHVP